MALHIDGETAEGRAFLKQLEQLEKLGLFVGFQDGSGSYADGISVAQVAAWNELGNSRVPSRPFLRQSFENHEPEIGRACEAQAKTLLTGGTAQTVYDALGVYMKGMVQKEIVSGGFVPNAPYTIRMKGSSTPLIDTGQMRQSVNYVIRDK